MITGKFEELDKIVQTNRCSKHNNPLVVAWHPGENSHVIRCGAGHYPEEVEELVSITKQHTRGIAVTKSDDYSLLPKADLGDGKVLSPVQVELLKAYARKYGLDAYRGHVVYMYGEPYIGLDGYLYKANTSGKPYSLTSRPLFKEERADYQVAEGDHAWIAYLKFAKDGGTFSGLGIVTRDEMTAMSTKTPGRLRSPVVAAHPWQLGQKRAEWQALRRGFPIGESPEEELNVEK